MSKNLPPGHYVRGGKGAGKEYVLNSCPQCGKKEKFYWNLWKLEGTCFYCDLVIKGWRRFREFFPDLDEEAPASPRSFVPDLTGPEKMPFCLAAPMVAESRAYLLSRWVDNDTAMVSRIYYHEESQHLYVRLESPEPRQPSSWVKRRINPEGGWIVAPGTTRSKYAFGWDFIPAARDQVILVEGIFDVLSPGLLGFAVATMGSVLSLDLLAWVSSRFKYVWLWYDPDAAGDKAREAISFALRAWGIPYSVINTDVDPGAFRDQEFLDKLKNKLTLSITV